MKIAKLICYASRVYCVFWALQFPFNNFWEVGRVCLHSKYTGFPKRTAVAGTGFTKSRLGYKVWNIRIRIMKFYGVYSQMNRWLLIVSILVPVAVLTLVVKSTLIAPQKSEIPPEEPRPYVPLVYRLQAKLEFDGVPIPVDVAVGCIGNRPETQRGLGRPQGIPLAPLILKAPRAGGNLTITTGHNFCLLFSEDWAPGQGISGIEPPDGWLPRMTWNDTFDMADFEGDVLANLMNRRYQRIEYVSAAGVLNPNSRLKIIEPFKVLLDSFPPTLGALDEAHAVVDTYEASLATRRAYTRQLNTWTDANNLDGAEPHPKFTRVLTIVPEEEWRDPLARLPFENGGIHPNHITNQQRIADYIDGFDKPVDTILSLGDGYDLIGENESVRLLSALEVGRRKRGFEETQQGGLAQPNLPRLGLNMTQASADRLRRGSQAFRRINLQDENVSLACNGGFLEPDFGNPGVIIRFYPRCGWPGPPQLRVPGKHVQRPEGIGNSKNNYFDTSTNNLWLAQ